MREVPQRRKMKPTMSPSKPRIEPRAIKNSIPSVKLPKKSISGIITAIIIS